MQTKTNTKAKLSLNKRTILLLNEQTMSILNGGTHTTATNESEIGCRSHELRCNVTYPATKNPNDIKCGTNKSNICPEKITNP
jgi:hypothetical protein